MAVVYSKLADAFLNQKKIRTQNFRGSLLSTSGMYSGAWTGGAQNDVLCLCAVPFRARLDEIVIAFNQPTNALRCDLAIAGINKDGTLTEIQTPICAGCGITGAMPNANSWYYILPANSRHKTIYQMLCNAPDGQGRIKPIDAFKPYEKDQYGMLYLVITAPEAVQNLNETYFNVKWVEQSPSDSCLTDEILPSKASHTF